MKAIILAAGAGRRLGLPGPKCLVEIGGQSILHRQLEAFRAAAVDEFVIVVGHAREQLLDRLAGEPGRFTYIANERYADTNTIYSLYLARERLAGGFYYANADVVFDRRLVERLRDCPAESALAVVVGRCAEEEVKVIVQGAAGSPRRASPEADSGPRPTPARITRIGKRLDPGRCLGEFVGVARFGAAVAPAFTATLVELVENHGIVDDYFERAVDRLCDHWPLTAVEVSDLPCREIDFPEDLRAAREQIAPLLV